MSCCCKLPVDWDADTPCQPDVQIVETTNGMSGKKILIIGHVSVVGMFLATMESPSSKGINLLEKELDEVKQRERELSLQINTFHHEFVDPDVHIVENQHPFHIFMPKQSNRHHARIRKRHVQRLHPFQRK